MMIRFLIRLGLVGDAVVYKFYSVSEIFHSIGFLYILFESQNIIQSVIHTHCYHIYVNNKLFFDLQIKTVNWDTTIEMFLASILVFQLTFLLDF